MAQRGEKLHRRALNQIPTPRYIVFYNGLDERPEREILYLSDAFENKRVEGCLEMKAEVSKVRKYIKMEGGKREGDYACYRVLHRP